MKTVKNTEKGNRSLLNLLFYFVILVLTTALLGGTTYKLYQLVGLNDVIATIATLVGLVVWWVIYAIICIRIVAQKIGRAIEAEKAKQSVTEVGDTIEMEADETDPDSFQPRVSRESI